MIDAPTRRMVPGPAGPLAVHLQGDETGPAIVMTHSVLSSSAMWDDQAALLAARGMRVIRIDTRGHGASPATPPPYTMDALGDDAVAVLDALGIPAAHYIGLSLGGMSGFGLGIRHPGRWLSLCLCDARADAPPAVAAPWDERIATVRAQGSCAPLAAATIVRWFGQAFVAAHPDVAARFVATASATAVDGFVGCAQAIQGLDDIGAVGRITSPVTLVVGANDGVLPQAMRELQAAIPGAVLELVADAGHLPNIDQPAAFDAALLRHLERAGAITPPLHRSTP